MPVQYYSLNIQLARQPREYMANSPPSYWKIILRKPWKSVSLLNGDTSSLTVLPEYNSSAQFSTVAQSWPTLVAPWTAASQAYVSIKNSQVHPKLCPLSWWCHPTILSPVNSFSSCPQSFPASGSSKMSVLFSSGDQSIGISASTLIFPMNTLD